LNENFTVNVYPARYHAAGYGGQAEPTSRYHTPVHHLDKDIDPAKSNYIDEILARLKSKNNVPMRRAA